MSESVRANATVLRVEDEAVSQVWLDSLIGEVFPAAALITAGSVHEAIAALSDSFIDVALVDLGLPDGSGVEVIRRLAQSNPLALSIVVTGFDDDEHVLEAIQAGAQGYLLKTERADVVIDQLRLLAEGVPQLSPSVARRLLQHFSGASRDPVSGPPERGAGGEDELLPRTRLPSQPLASSVLRPAVCGDVHRQPRVKRGVARSAVQDPRRSDRALGRQAGGPARVPATTLAARPCASICNRRWTSGDEIRLEGARAVSSPAPFCGGVCAPALTAA